MQMVQKAFSFTFSDCHALVNLQLGGHHIIYLPNRRDEITLKNLRTRNLQWFLSGCSASPERQRPYSIDFGVSSSLPYLVSLCRTFRCHGYTLVEHWLLALGDSSIFGCALNHICLYESERSGRARPIIPRSLRQTPNWSFRCWHVSTRCSTTDPTPAILLSSLIPVSGSHLSAGNRLAHRGYREVRGISEKVIHDRGSQLKGSLWTSWHGVCWYGCFLCPIGDNRPTRRITSQVYTPSQA